MVDISIVDGIINQLITGGYHIVYVYIIIYILIINHIESYRYRFDIICVYIYITQSWNIHPKFLIRPRGRNIKLRSISPHTLHLTVCAILRFQSACLVVRFPCSSHMLHGAGIFSSQHLPERPKSPSHVGVHIPAPWFAYVHALRLPFS